MERERTMDEAADLVARVCAYLEDVHPQVVQLADLGRQFHTSPYYLQRLFKRITGVSPHQYAANLRVDDLKTRLAAGRACHRCHLFSGLRLAQPALRKQR